MAYLWHTTKLSNVKSIMKEGLKAQVPSQRPYHPKGVYLSDYMLEWMRNTTMDGSNGAVLKINIDGLWLVRDRHTKDENLKSMGKDYICLADIPKSRIMEVMAEVNRGHLQHIYTGKQVAEVQGNCLKLKQTKEG